VSWKPEVNFEKQESAVRPADADIEQTLANGLVSNTALSLYRASRRIEAERAAPYARFRPSPQVHARRHPHRRAVEVSDPSLDRSDESAVAINPKDPRNIVAGAVSFDGSQFINTAYVTKNGGHTWKTVTALSDVDEGAGIAFDGHGNCYYTTMQGGFFPVCVISQDGGLTWSQPAAFGFGDKTAVDARGRIALCGFDRINTEACAYTLDGGLTWTVHDFTDSGLGTAPLISYDHQSFYIIYGALDNNLKMYASHDQGQTWTGPTVIVAGNSAFSTIGGPLNYEGDALTSPGTNVAIDHQGRLHILYVDSNTSTPMYISSEDQGATWSAPVNVDPCHANLHMWPCLSSNRHGDLQAGSVLFDATLGKYSILRHVKDDDEDEWRTREADTGPWAAAGPSPNFRIGFGDYFDCDSSPSHGIIAMAWSETVDGQQPWQTWVRLWNMHEHDQDRFDALADQVFYLEAAHNAGELPFPATQENEAAFADKLASLRAEQQKAEEWLIARRARDSLPEDSLS
jgi:hypothetical protein